MATQSQWVVLVAIVTSLVAIATATPDHHDDDDDELAMDCCDGEKVLPPLFSKESPACAKADDALPEEVAESQRHCKMVECILVENGMLYENLTVNEEETKTLFAKQEDPNLKSVQEAVLAECLRKHDRSPAEELVGDTCESEGLLLYTCISQGVLRKCPKDKWRADEPGCSKVL